MSRIGAVFVCLKGTKREVPGEWATSWSVAGVLNPLDCPHHVRADQYSPYREGVVLDKPVREGKGSFVNVGLKPEAQIDKKLQAGIRVTVQMCEEGESVIAVIAIST